jgi:hypothetical protein
MTTVPDYNAFINMTSSSAIQRQMWKDEIGQQTEQLNELEDEEYDEEYDEDLDLFVEILEEEQDYKEIKPLKIERVKDEDKELKNNEIKSFKFNPEDLDI